MMFWKRICTWAWLGISTQKHWAFCFHTVSQALGDAPWWLDRKKALLSLFLLLLWLKTHLAEFWKEEETTRAHNVAKAPLDKKCWEQGWAGSSLSPHWDLWSSRDPGAGTASTRGAYESCCFKVICAFTVGIMKLLWAFLSLKSQTPEPAAQLPNHKHRNSWTLTGSVIWAVFFRVTLGKNL